MLALAVDLGTTAAKAAVVSLDGVVLGSGIEPVATRFGRGGMAEQDAEMVWLAVLTAAAKALDRTGAAARDGVAVVCCTGQWASLVPVDNRGCPVGPMLTWLDGRGGDRVAQITSGADGPAVESRWRELHGFVPGTSLTHLLYLQHDNPEVHARAVAYLEPVDYLTARFCGVIATTGNTSMPMALTDTRQLGATSWSDELCNLAGVDRTRLPTMVAARTVLRQLLPEVADQLGLSRNVSVTTGANDSVAMAFGTNAIDDDRATVVIGTTGVLTAHNKRRVSDVARSVVTMPSAMDDRFYVVAEGGLGGKALEVFLTQLAPSRETTRGDATGDVFASVDALAGSVAAGADGVMFLPWLIGSMAPNADDRQRGAFVGLSLRSTRSHLLRAVLEGVALQMRWLTDEVSAVLGVDFPTLRFAGGGAESSVWAQVMADVLRRPVEIVADPRQANARGAAALGFVATGAMTERDLAGFVSIAQVYEPDARHTDLYNERLGVFRRLHHVLGEPIGKLHAR